MADSIMLGEEEEGEVDERAKQVGRMCVPEQ
jgi:hypothetical protein